MSVHPLAHKMRLNWIVRHVRGHRILDIGPIGGGGFYSIHRALKKANPDSKVYALDLILDSKFVKGTSTQGARGDIAAIPFQDDSFDTVFAGEILEHIPNPYLALKEIARISQPGANIFITLPNGHRFNSLMRNLFNMNRREDWIKKHWTGFHHYEFSLPQINTLARSQGLKVLSISSFPLQIGGLILRPCWPLRNFGIWWMAHIQKPSRDAHEPPRNNNR